MIEKLLRIKKHPWYVLAIVPAITPKLPNKITECQHSPTCAKQTRQWNGQIVSWLGKTSSSFILWSSNAQHAGRVGGRLEHSVNCWFIVNVKESLEQVWLKIGWWCRFTWANNNFQGRRWRRLGQLCTIFDTDQKVCRCSGSNTRQNLAQRKINRGWFVWRISGHLRRRLCTSFHWRCWCVHTVFVACTARSFTTCTKTFSHVLAPVSHHAVLQRESR